MATSTLMGAKLFHEGQFEGCTVRLPVFLGRRPDAPAVRVRDVRSALDHEDVSLFIQPAQARRTRCAAGHSANDDYFHEFFFLSMIKLCP